MKKLLLTALVAQAACLAPLSSNAQLSTNPDKFLGNITTWGSINTDGIEFASLWNQITAENESKWSSIEGSRNNYNWGGCDNCYNYAKNHDFPFKFHTLIWGSQYPSWMDNLNSAVQYREIEEWMDAIKARYPDLPMIDVVNEAIPGHAPAPYKNALGGDGYSGYDWIIKAFEMAHERWPEAILIYNDYNTFLWQRTEFINLVRTLRDAGAPIDAYGCQSHDLTDMSFTDFKNAMAQIQSSLKMPMYSTEYDIGTSDDQKQYRQYSDQIKYMWEQDYVAGITLWGYIYGKTWVTDGNSGIIRDGQDRPAMTWLREYMASDAAKTAKSPFPDMKKEASVYIRPSKYFGELDVPLEINVDATLRTKTIDHIDFYINDALNCQLTEAPYVVEYLPTKKGKVNFKAVVFDTEGNTYERLGGCRVVGERKPFNGTPIQIPGTFEAEDFDMGGDGYSYHDSDYKNEGTSAYRTDADGVDIVTTDTGYAIGYTAVGEWLEYTVQINESGKYVYEVVASSGSNNSKFVISWRKEGAAYEDLMEVEVGNTGGWDTYNTFTGTVGRRLAPGDYTLRLTITGAQANIDKITIKKKNSGIEDAEAFEAGVYDVFTATGIAVGTVECDNDNFNAQIRNLTGRGGLYLIRNQANGQSHMVQIK